MTFARFAFYPASIAKVIDLYQDPAFVKMLHGSYVLVC